jgi:ubiquitin-protein ligase
MLLKKVNKILSINLKDISSYFFLGEVSIDLLNPAGSWTPTTTLVTVVEEITKIIDRPSLDRVQYPG